jgi:hypothetical protein
MDILGLDMTLSKPMESLSPITGTEDKSFSLSNLFSNKLFLQYLSAAGADITAGKGPVNVNALTQQTIQSQNYKKLLQHLLGSGGKLTADEKGVKMDIPKESFKSFLSGGEKGGGIMNIKSPVFNTIPLKENSLLNFFE